MRRRLLPIVVSLAGACLIGLLVYGISTQAASRTLDTEVHEGKHPPAPEAARRLPVLGGAGTGSLASLRGKVVLLNFWATWCAPCREEIPALEALHRSHAGRVVVLGASVFSSDRDTEAFLREHGVDYPVFYGSFELMEKYDRVAVIPTTFVIDGKGEIAAKVVGARTREQYEAIIGPLLEP
jgi:cytochrome c biogenesis protein CcmG, thiol:disulfide interchange protein DsbE